MASYFSFSHSIEKTEGNKIIAEILISAVAACLWDKWKCPWANRIHTQFTSWFLYVFNSFLDWFLCAALFFSLSLIMSHFLTCYQNVFLCVHCTYVQLLTMFLRINCLIHFFFAHLPVRFSFPTIMNWFIFVIFVRCYCSQLRFITTSKKNSACSFEYVKLNGMV